MFHCSNIETELAAVLGAFNSDASLRTCRNCGHVTGVAGEFVLEP